MTAKIPRSLIGPNFEVEVAAFAFDLKNWREHMKRVEEDAANHVPRAEAHQAYTRPQVRELIDAAVDENGVADYEIMEDGPTPEQLLAARKQELMQQVSIAEARAIEAVIPIGKRRMFNLRETDIRNKDSELIAALAEKQKGVVAKVSNAVGLGKSLSAEEMAATIREARPEEDTAHLEAQAARRARIAAIERVAAQAHHDIEDLTSETIDAWQVPDFPEEG